MQNNKAIIIGSGIAGMATAIRLSVKGYEVAVYEKNDQPGGKISGFEMDGFRFDAGPSLFTQPENIAELFELAGESMEGKFSYKPIEVACTYFYENGKTVKAYSDPDKFEEELITQLDEKPGSGLRYLDRSRNLYNAVASMFLNHSLHKRKTWLHKRTGHALGALRLNYLFSSLHNYNKKRFKSPEAVQLFDRFATYNGSNPYKAPAMLSLIPHLEQNQGTFYPRGGMISITRAIYELALRKGVRFYFGKGVERIIHTEGKIKGVVVNGENLLADIVVSNADIYFTYKTLLRNPPKAQQLLKQERSSSAIVFYWGINKPFPKLGLHNIFFSSAYQEEFNDIFKENKLSEDPTVYINISSKIENADAPVGKENWFVMVNAPTDEGQDWEILRDKLRTNIIAKISRMTGEDLASCIETERVMDPSQISEQTTSFRGSLYGTSSNSKLAAFFRPANYTGKIKGLYFCGGTVHPGGGIPLCLKSAKIVGNLVKSVHE